MVIRRMDTLGPRSLTPAQDSITPVCLVGVYRCGGRAIHPVIPRADGQAGIRVGWGGVGGGGCIHLGPAHITCMTDVKRPCTRSLKHTHTHTLPGSIRHSVMMEGHLSPCAAGACLAGEARKAMALFSCKKLKNLPSVQ